MSLTWYDPQFFPDSAEGYVYIIRLDTPYIGGMKKVRVGGHYEVVDGKRRLVGGELKEIPQMVYAYSGWSPNPWKRYDAHMAGRGCRLLAYLASIGMTTTLVAVAPGGRDEEAKLKRLHNNRALLKYC